MARQIALCSWCRQQSIKKMLTITDIPDALRQQLQAILESGRMSDAREWYDRVEKEYDHADVA